jgi:hypothetical protein
MDKLGSILEKWNTNKDIEGLISEGLFSDQTAIQSSLNKLSGEQRTHVLQQLDEIETAIRDYIANLDKEQKIIKKQIDNAHKSEKACLSYGSSIDLQDKGKDKKIE